MKEEIIARAPQFALDGITRTIGDLIFTTQRLLFVATAKNTDLAFAVFGWIGSLIATSRSRRKSVELQALNLAELDALCDSDHKYGYSELENITVRDRVFAASFVAVTDRSGRRTRFRGKSDDLKALRERIQQLAAAGAPIAVE